MTPQEEQGLKVLRTIVRQRILVTDSTNHLSVHRPVTAVVLKTLTRVDRAELDALIHRTARLQDYLGKQGFKAVLIVGYDDVPESMIDLLGEMERRGILRDIEEWGSLRAARNGLAHEDGMDDDRTAQALESALAALPVLTAIADRTILHLAARLRPDDPDALVRSFQA